MASNGAQPSFLTSARLVDVEGMMDDIVREAVEAAREEERALANAAVEAAREEERALVNAAVEAARQEERAAARQEITYLRERLRLSEEERTELRSALRTLYNRLLAPPNTPPLCCGLQHRLTLRHSCS